MGALKVQQNESCPQGSCCPTDATCTKGLKGERRVKQSGSVLRVQG